METKYKKLIALIKKDFKININGNHGIRHWLNVYKNTQILAKHYKIESDVFALFSLLHDSKREYEYKDLEHGKRAGKFVEKLLEQELISLSKEDVNRLIFACSNHTKTDKENVLYKDMIVQICIDADRLDIGRVGYEVNKYYLSTEHAKSLVHNGRYMFEDTI